MWNCNKWTSIMFIYSLSKLVSDNDLSLVIVLVAVRLANPICTQESIHYYYFIPCALMVYLLTSSALD